jgi:hypothetical protein
MINAITVGEEVKEPVKVLTDSQSTPCVLPSLCLGNVKHCFLYVYIHLAVVEISAQVHGYVCVSPLTQSLASCQRR